MYTPLDHTFVICAYQENPFLPDCIRSLGAQSVKSRILLATSTPSGYLERLCRENSIPMVVNHGPTGIAEDWNFAYESADTPLVTIAHQDDIYEPAYLETMLRAFNQRLDTCIAYSDYYEIRDGKRVESNRLLRIKRMMNAPMRRRRLQGWRWVRRWMLRFGDPICCPAVTYSKKNISFHPLFDSSFRNNCDYEAYLRIASLRGAFAYTTERLVGHRIYAESTTSFNIRENVRDQEDYRLLQQMWPKPVAKLILKYYRQGQESNALDEGRP